MASVHTAQTASTAALVLLMEYLVSWTSRYLDTRHLYGIPL